MWFEERERERREEERKEDLEKNLDREEKEHSGFLEKLQWDREEEHDLRQIRWRKVLINDSYTRPKVKNDTAPRGGERVMGAEAHETTDDEERKEPEDDKTVYWSDIDMDKY